MAFEFTDNLLILNAIVRVLRDNDAKFNSPKLITVELGHTGDDDFCFYEDEKKYAVGLSAYTHRPFGVAATTPGQRKLCLHFYKLDANGDMPMVGQIDESPYAMPELQYIVDYKLPGLFEAKVPSGPSLDYVFEYKAASMAILAWLRTGQAIPATEYETMLASEQRARLLGMLNKY